MKAAPAKWRTFILLAVLAGLLAGSFYGFKKLHAFLYPAIPTAMAQIPIPENVNMLGEAMLAYCRKEMVPSFDKDPVITSVTPQSGPPSTMVTVRGSGFRDEQGSNAVAVNLTEAVPKAEVLKWTDEEIQFLVPEHATSGDVTITLWEYLRTEKMPNGSYRPVCKNPRPSNGIPFTVTGQEERIKLGQAVFFGWTQLNEEASSEVRIPRAKIAVDPRKYEKYGFLPREKNVEIDEGDAARFTSPTPIVGVRVVKGQDGETRVGYSCAYCHTGRDPANGTITPGLPSSTLQFGKLIAMAPNLPEDMRQQAANWPPGTSDLSFRYFPDGIENPAAIMLARGTHGFRFWSSGGLAMPEYQRHSNAWLMQGAPYMAPLKISISLCCYLSTLRPVKNPSVNQAAAERGRKAFAESCIMCHSPAHGYFTNQRVIPFDAIGSNSPPTKRMTDTGGIRVAPLLSVYATAPYLHDHSCATIDDLLDPARLVPGSPIYKKPYTKHPPHPWVVTDAQKRSDIVEFVRSL